MSRREERRKERRLEALVKGIGGLFLLLALAIGGMKGFVPVLITMVFGALGLALIGGLGYLGYRFYRAKTERDARASQAVSTSIRRVNLGYPAAPVPPRVEPVWNLARIEDALGEIDWYQFEKFCATLLRSEGFSVERRGGAQPDGGVDLVATKNGESMLVQCKHWKTWTVQERVIRELLGSMTHYQVKRGALYVLKGATRPAQTFAAQHDIHVADSSNLAERARNTLTYSELSDILSSRDHHCPKCESLMVWRTGNFTPFWGCSTYPRCRATLKHSGAR
ncbi:MAG: restriction endonuclease [Opitutaceae bacterium]|jgi:ssDNA-binding Zn-finger/Zn-ribbon topoisomerase 1